MTRGAHHRYWTKPAAVACLVAGLLMLMTMTACRRGMPVSDPDLGSAEAPGTISGTVRGAESARSVEGRVVEVVNLETSERQRVTTDHAGGFTVRVQPGTYKVELTLLGGETLVKQPGIMTVNRSEFDANADFVIRTGTRGGRASRPRTPAYRMDPGLGSPTA